MKPIIPSINYHLTKACSMRCKFCFANFDNLGKINYDLKKAKILTDDAVQCGFEKTTLAVGEPTIVKELEDILLDAKSKGPITTIVKNDGKLVKNSFLNPIAPHMDWLALSIRIIHKNQWQNSNHLFLRRFSSL